MEANCNGSKRKGEAGEEKQMSDLKKQNVTMRMSVFDCPVCFEPLRPPIYQCSMGHFFCRPCRDKLPESKCHVCSEAATHRCCGMELVVDSIVVPCKHGCGKKMTYYEKAEHETRCPDGPCFCPVSGCGFAGPKAALLAHFTGLHNWEPTRFEYYKPFDLPAKPGMHVLRAETGHIFLLNVALPDALGHPVSLVCVQANAPESLFGCSMSFSWCTHRHQAAWLDVIRNSSLAEGPPMDYFCILPRACCEGTDAVLKITLSAYLELEALNEDDDSSYDEEEDEEDEVEEAEDYSDEE